LLAVHKELSTEINVDLGRVISFVSAYKMPVFVTKDIASCTSTGMHVEPERLFAHGHLKTIARIETCKVDLVVILFESDLGSVILAVFDIP
jgi:hypothetical protein